tara:strand:- start:44 stop:205 length:162 start_codon:yes stop_codon:yes gene_type:complete
MSTLTQKIGDNPPSLDGPSDLRPEVKTSFILKRETPAAPKVKKTKKTTTTKES